MFLDRKAYPCVQRRFVSARKDAEDACMREAHQVLFTRRCSVPEPQHLTACAQDDTRRILIGTDEDTIPTTTLHSLLRFNWRRWSPAFRFKHNLQGWIYLRVS